MHQGRGVRRVATAVAALIVLGVVPAVAGPGSAGAATTLPPGFAETVLTDKAIFAPTLMTFMPDGRILVAQQNGKIKVVKNGAVLDTPFLSLNVESNSDRGILGIALDPAFAVNHYVYVYYHRATPTIHGVISRFVANGDVGVPASETVLYQMDSLNFTGVHTGGVMQFGPDGKLYVSVGDDARGNVVSQSLTSDLGKFLRINSDGSIPTDNPFFAQASGKYRSIWAIGLRNPYSWSFSATGRMLINEVGLATWEELNEGVAGGNYGWPAVEGIGHDPRFIDPVYAYLHGSGPNEGCATIGGDFADPGGSGFPASYDGRYFFSDHCNGWIKTYDPTTGSVQDFATGIAAPTHLQFGPDGSLYYVSRDKTGQGLPARIVRISYTGDPSPSIDQQPGDVTTGVGESASFSVTANGTGPLSYQWLRDGNPIDGATQPSFTLPAVADTDDGAQFRVAVTNAFGTATSNVATLHVVTNRAPTITFTDPKAGNTYAGGQVVYYAATATDPEDGVLPASAFQYNIVFHHDDHTHPFITPAPGRKGGTFTAPASGFEKAPTVWFRIHLTVTDSAGRTTSSYRDILPKTTNVTVKSLPAGGSLDLEGATHDLPYTFVGVARMERTLTALSPVTIGTQSWVFDAWSDFGAQTHGVTPAPGSASYTAVYRLNAGVVGTGTGLKATYFDNPDLTAPVVSTVEPVILHSKAVAAAPAPGVSPGTYSVRWEGSVAAQFNQAYTFFAQADDGVRVWVNGNLVIDQWGPHANTEYQSAPVTLTAGTKVPVRVEFRQGSGRLGQVRLMWKSNSTPKSVVPSAQLFPAP